MLYHQKLIYTYELKSDSSAVSETAQEEATMRGTAERAEIVVEVESPPTSVMAGAVKEFVQALRAQSRISHCKECASYLQGH
ncbi:hypothetical protein Aduo_012228 [Ancylostoma duodenale]